MGKGRVGINTRAVHKVRHGLSKSQFYASLGGSSRQRAALSIFEQAERLGYKSAFPTPWEARAYVEAHQPKPKVRKTMPGQSTSKMKYVVRLNLKGAAFPRYAKTVHGVTHHVRALGQKQFAKVPLIATIKNRVTGKVASLMKTYHGGKQKYLAYTHVGTKRDTYHKTLKAGARSAVMKTGTIRVKSHMARKMGHGYRVKAHTRKRSRR